MRVKHPIGISIGIGNGDGGVDHLSNTRSAMQGRLVCGFDLKAVDYSHSLVTHHNHSHNFMYETHSSIFPRQADI